MQAKVKGSLHVRKSMQAEDRQESDMIFLSEQVDGQLSPPQRRFKPLTYYEQAQLYTPAISMDQREVERKMEEMLERGVIGAPKSSDKRQINRLFGSRRKGS